jgi:ribosomal protein S18 acetylase RimI-like enzyme
MFIRALNEKDIPAWLALAHESDSIIARMIPDIAVFYHDFDEYITRKTEQYEAFMATDILTGKCLGIIAFSRTYNRITFLGVTKTAEFSVIGTKLMDFVLNQLDNTREITANVIKSNTGIFQKEYALYKRFGFIETDNKIMENGIPARQMKRDI